MYLHLNSFIQVYLGSNSRRFILLNATAHLEPIPGRLRSRWEYTLDGKPVHLRAPCAHTHTQQRGRGAVHAGHATKHSGRVKLLYLHPGARITARTRRKQSHVLSLARVKLVCFRPKLNFEYWTVYLNLQQFWLVSTIN